MRFVLVAVACGLALSGCKMNAQEQAIADDATCLKLGAPRGSERAFQCKLALEVQHRNDETSHNAVADAIVVQNRQEFMNTMIYGNRPR